MIAVAEPLTQSIFSSPCPPPPSIAPKYTVKYKDSCLLQVVVRQLTSFSLESGTNPRYD